MRFGSRFNAPVQQAARLGLAIKHERRGVEFGAKNEMSRLLKRRIILVLTSFQGKLQLTSFYFQLILTNLLHVRSPKFFTHSQFRG